MRLALVISCLVAAACTDSAPQQAAACTGMLQCNGPDCQLATAEQDASLCPALEQPCGGYTIITEQGTDTATAFYYGASGALVATIHTEPSGRTDCAAPASFRAPACATPSQMLAVCGAQP